MYHSTIKGPKRGVSVYSYSDEFGVTMNLEDCFQDLYDMGAHGVEILANAHIEGYPRLTDAFLAEWNRLCDKYEIEPAEYGHWIDTRLYKDRYISLDEAAEVMTNDFKIANALGFHVLRTKQGVVDFFCTPVPNWKEYVLRVLDKAEEYDVCMCPEIHLPTNLEHPVVQEFCEFIDKTGTKHFGLNIDFSVFQTDLDAGIGFGPGITASKVSALVPLLPYVKCCHAKFNHMTDDFQETTIPYEEILTTLKAHNWDGYLVSEYEGADRDTVGLTSHILRKQHVMMKRILGY